MAAFCNVVSHFALCTSFNDDAPLNVTVLRPFT